MVPGRISTVLIERYGREICRWRIRVSRARERADQKSEDTSEHDHDIVDEEGGNDDDKEVRRGSTVVRGRVSTSKPAAEAEGGVVPSFRRP